jgi:3HB-oligomer hydrolase (3HBOH)
MKRYVLALELSFAGLLIPSVAAADCAAVQAALGGNAADVVCFQSTDLTTNNASGPPTGPTTPADNSLPGLPVGAFTPLSDRAVPSDVPTPITKVVPGLQVQGRFADDPAGQARFILRFPNNWNGRLVVAGAGGTLSEFSGDIAFSDYVLQQGYAYASQNKGVFNLQSTTASDPLGCRQNPSSTTFVRYYDDDPAKPWTQWTTYIIEAAQLAVDSAKAQYGSKPKRTYAVGGSNGGYQVRRAIEGSPTLFDGGLDWEGVFVGPNPFVDLPLMLKQFPLYVASGFNPASAASQAIQAGGYPPDIINSGGQSFWQLQYQLLYEVTMCQWQKQFDPAYDTYGAGLANYDYAARAKVTDIASRLAAVEPTGKIKRTLVTVAGSEDGIVIVNHHARKYAAEVAAYLQQNQDDQLQYRYWEIQNGNHIDAFKNLFPQLQRIMPYAQHAFDLMVQFVETGATLPPSQCVPPGGAISATPAQPGLCPQLLVP